MEDLLGRHVAQLALELALLGDLSSGRRLRDSEVHHAGDTIHTDEDVLRRNVAVDQVQGVAGLAGGLIFN